MARPEDQAILAGGHGGYSVDTRFEERWTPVDPPEDAPVVPPLEAVLASHPYLQHIAARGWEVHSVWAVRVQKGPDEVSVAGRPRLLYVYENQQRDETEAVVITDAPRFVRWVEAMGRQKRG